MLGIPFDVVTPDVEELTDGDPSELVLANARLKAAAGAELVASDAVVVGVDTEVVIGGRALGKPADQDAARRCLSRLSGRNHEVRSGVCLLRRGRTLEGIEVTEVTVRDLSPAEIDLYVDSGEWRGRAGGYAIQGLGSSLVSAVAGDLSNVIGLPIPLLSRLIASLQDR